MARGSTAEHPKAIPSRGWLDIVWRVKDSIFEDNIGLLAAGVAFYGLLSLFPLVTALVAVAGVVTDPSQITSQIQSFSGALPEDVANIIVGQVRDVSGSSPDALTLTAVAGVLIALYSASRGVNNLIIGLNVAYGEDEKRGIVMYYLTVFALTLALVLGIVVTLLLLAALPALVALFGDSRFWSIVVQVLRWPMLLLIGTAGIAVLYRWGPSRRAAQWRWLTPGAAVACLLWVLGSFGFSWYVQNFAGYNETFGALGGVIVLLMWLWISAYIVLLGAEIDGEMEAQTGRDSTVGPDRPMGERGAVKADTVAAGVAAGTE